MTWFSLDPHAARITTNPAVFKSDEDQVEHWIQSIGSRRPVGIFLRAMFYRKIPP